MWTLTLDDVAMTEADMTAGEDELVFTLAVANIAHAWEQIRPTHCPACLNAHTATLLVMRGGLDLEAAAARVAGMQRSELIGCLSLADDG